MEEQNSGGEEWQAIIANPDSMHGDVDIDAFADTVHAAFEKIIDENTGETVVAFHAMVTMCFSKSSDAISTALESTTSITRVQASKWCTIYSVCK